MTNPIAKKLLANAAREKNPVLREALLTKSRRLTLRDEVHECSACPLRVMSEIDRPFSFRGPTPAILAVVLDQPTKRDVRPNTRPAWLASPSTPAGKLLDRLLSYVGLTRDHVWLDAATKCPTHNRLGGNLLAPGTLSVAGRTRDELGPGTCVDLYAERGLKLSKAEVVICMGATAFLVAKQHRAFTPRATFEQARTAQPMLQAGKFWIVTHGLEQTVTCSTKLAEVMAAYRMASGLLEDQILRRAQAEFPDSNVMPHKTYEQICGEVMAQVGEVLANYPPDRARLKIIDALGAVVDLLENSPQHTQRLNAKYAIRLLRDLEAGKIVWPKIGHEAKGNE